jgi:outer membrane protein assembly factor BamB
MKKYFLIPIFLFLTIALTSCVGGTSASSWPGLTVDAEHDTAYLAYGSYIYAVDLQTGLELWKYPTKASAGKSFYAPPVLTSQGQLVIGSYNGIVYSLDPSQDPNLRPDNILELLSVKNDRVVGSPLVTEQAIYVPTIDGRLFALDLKGNPYWVSPFKAKDAIWGQPVIDSQGQVIYVTSMDHHLYALDARSGAEMWKPVKLDGAMVSSPVISPDGKIYVGTFGSKLYTLDANNQGAIIGTPFETDGWVWASPALSGNFLFFGDLKGSFYFLDTVENTSKKITLDGPVLSTPLVVSDTVYVTTEAGSLYTLGFDGRNIRPALTLKAKLQAPPVAYKDVLLITPVGGSSLLIALDAQGNQLWAYPPPKPK